MGEGLGRLETGSPGADLVRLVGWLLVYLFGSLFRLGGVHDLRTLATCKGACC